MWELNMAIRTAESLPKTGPNKEVRLLFQSHFQRVKKVALIASAALVFSAAAIASLVFFAPLTVATGVLIATGGVMAVISAVILVASFKSIANLNKCAKEELASLQKEENIERTIQNELPQATSQVTAIIEEISQKSKGKVRAERLLLLPSASLLRYIAKLSVTF